MSLDSSLLIGASGLTAINQQLALVGQNVANANTPGYVRESLPQQALTASGIGMGVVTGPARRDLDTQMQAAVFAAQSQSSGAQTTSTALAAIDQVAGSTASGNAIADTLGALQDRLSALEATPADQTAQRAAVQQAQTLATATNQLAIAGATQRQNAQSSLTSDVQSLNTALRSIGTLSNQIIAAKALGQSTADLEQSRDQQINTATSLLGIQFVAQPNGDMQAISGSTVLPLHNATGPLQLASANLAPTTPATAIPPITLGGVDVTAQLQGGTIGANLQLRDQAMPQLQAELDEFAHTLATRFDAQGLRLFTDNTGTVPPGGGTPAQSGYVGMAQTLQVNPAILSNPRLVQQGTTGATPPPGDPTLLQNALQYALGTDRAPGTSQPPPATTGLGLTGTLTARFSPPASLAAFATAIGAAQAQDTNAAQTAATTAAATASTLQSKLAATDGVSMDTELSHMVALQNAYSANARIVSAAQSMWTSLLAAVTP